MENVRVAIWGFGAMGSGIARMLLGKQGVEITGVEDSASRRSMGISAWHTMMQRTFRSRARRTTSG